jgi:Dolichyl-phosphate-mannose-protein mannosyltransferase/Tetratricopeptide repeat
MSSTNKPAKNKKQQKENPSAEKSKWTSFFSNLLERFNRNLKLHKHLLVILLIGLGLRLWHITWGLPNVFEEATPFTVSWKFWNWNGTGLDLNPHFFNYPALTFYIQFVGQIIHYFVGYILGVYSNLSAFQNQYNTDPTLFILIGRLLTVIFDVGTIVFIYLLINRLIDKRTAVVAAFLVAINNLHIKQAQLINVDTPLTFFILLSVFFMYRIYSEPILKWYILSGMSIGLAAGTKYNGAGLLVILIIVHFTRSSGFSKNFNLKDLKFLLTSFIIAAGAFLITNPYVLLESKEFLHDFRFEEQHVAYGHLGINKAESGFVYYLMRVLPTNLGTAFCIVIALSFLYFLMDRAMLKRYLILLLLPVLYVAVIGSWEMRAERYVLPAVSFLVMIGTIGIVDGTIWMLGNIKKVKPAGMKEDGKFVTIPLVIVVILLTIEPSIVLFSYQREQGLPDTRTTAKEWITQNMPRGSIIVTGPYGIEFPEQMYKIFPIPFLAVQTEKGAPFYNTQWYEDCDVLVTSDLDYGRYIKEPERYKIFLPFYDSLNLRWKLLFEAIGGVKQNGPTIRLYAPPAEKRDTLKNELLQQLLKLNDTSRVNHFLQNFFSLSRFRGKFGKIEQTVRAMLKYQPNNPNTNKALARFLIERKEYNQAIDELNAYLQKVPGDAEAIALVGMALYNLKNLNEAEQYFRRVLELDKKIEFAYDYLLSIYASRQDLRHMGEILRQYLDILPPGSKKAQLVANRLQQLEKVK